MKAPEHLQTRRLILRRWRQGDLESFTRMNQDARVLEFLLGPLSREQCEAFIGKIELHFNTHGFGLWAVQPKEGAESVGLVGLRRIPFERPFRETVEVAWRLAFESWGKGYATEAARAALQDGFERIGLDSIASFTVPANERSQRVMGKLRMRRGEDFDHPEVAPGHRLRRHVLYRLSRAEFERGEGA